MTQPIYNVYRGKGMFIATTYRVNIHTGEIQFHCVNYWARSECTLSGIAKEMPLVAKNVRFKA